MRIAVIGSGYVGLVSGACFSKFGTSVACVDKDAGKIAQLEAGKMPIYEPGLEQLVAANVKAKRLSFSTNLADSVKGADAIFIAVGTPSRRGDGHADLSYVFAAAEEIAKNLTGYAAIVTKSTVPVGTGRKVAEIIAKARPDLLEGRDYDVVSNPEFLREGSAIEDFIRPDRVVIGTMDGAAKAREVMRELYRPLYLIDTPVLFTGIETAELIKYAANAFLAAKITFINEMADLCEVVGADVQEVAKGIGLDGRIGRKFLHAGPGYGGSCFPKDCLALMRTAREAGAPVTIIETVTKVNDERKKKMAERVAQACGGMLDNKTVAVLGLTFKPNTDDMRDSPSLDIIPALQAKGAVIRAFDPEGMHEAAKLLKDVTYATDAYDAMEGADCLLIITEWNEFRQLDWHYAAKKLKRRAVVDLRNIYKPQQMAELGFTYSSIGHPKVEPSNA